MTKFDWAALALVLIMLPPYVYCLAAKASRAYFDAKLMHQRKYLAELEKETIDG